MKTLEEVCKIYRRFESHQVVTRWTKFILNLILIIYIRDMTYPDLYINLISLQSDVEKLEGLPVAPFMDREKVTKSSSQVGFIRFVLLPLFEALGALIPALEVICVV